MYLQEFFTPPTPAVINMLSIIGQRFNFKKDGSGTTYADHPANKPHLIGKRAGSLVRKSKKENRPISGGPSSRELRFTHDGKRYRLKEHQAIFLYFHGWLPPMIDHFDDNPLNNALNNLVPTTNQTNSSRRRTKSRPGYERGVIKEKNKYLVRLADPSLGRSKDGRRSKQRHFGRFASLDEANAVARAELINLRAVNARPLTHLVP
jgi:hypothetical protein